MYFLKSSVVEMYSSENGSSTISPISSAASSKSMSELPFSLASFTKCLILSIQYFRDLSNKGSECGPIPIYRSTSSSESSSDESSSSSSEELESLSEVYSFSFFARFSFPPILLNRFR
ncbi:hypothetical protein D3C80_1605120 [compost metagenome]